MDGIQDGKGRPNKQPPQPPQGLPELQHIDAKTMEQMTSQELLDLPHCDRLEVVEELHGVKSMAVPEQYDMLQRHTERFAHEIDAVPRDDPIREAFDRAVQLQSQFVVNHKLWLKFLRATFFQTGAAVRRFMNYLCFISSYFGDDALMRQVRFSDLTKNEEILIREGESQILRGRDYPLGRRVMAQLGGFVTDTKYTAANRTRIALYKNWVISEDEDTQLSGFVNIHFIWRDFRSMDPAFGMAMAQLARCSPVRCSAIHLCVPLDDPVLTSGAAAVMMILGADHRIRTRIHQGTVSDCQHKLAGFGINSSDIPLTYNGEIKNKGMVSWINSRKALEACCSDSNTGVVFQGTECPRNNDVIFKVGERGRHPGNARFRELLEGGEQMDRYKSTNSRTGKDEIVWGLAEVVFSAGGRFLSWDSRGFFVPIEDQDILKKQIASFIRDFNKRRAAKGVE